MLENLLTAFLASADVASSQTKPVPKLGLSHPTFRDLPLPPALYSCGFP